MVVLALAGPVDVLEDGSQDVSNGASRQNLTIRRTKIGDMMDMKRLSRQKRPKHPDSPQRNRLDEGDFGQLVDVESMELPEGGSKILIRSDPPTTPRAHTNPPRRPLHVLPQHLGCGTDQSMHGPGMPPHTSFPTVLLSPGSAVVAASA